MPRILHTKEHDVGMKQMHNASEEDVILRRYPFHECPTRQAMLTSYNYAVRYMFQIVREEHWPAVMGRLNRKLIKRFKELKESSNGQN